MNEAELRKRFPAASASFIQANADGVCASQPERSQGRALERPLPGEDSGRHIIAPRHRIRFTIYAVHPCDWDGYHIKELQDMLIHASILPDDNWGFLQGEVISEKVHSKADERTEIEIERESHES